MVDRFCASRRFLPSSSFCIAFGARSLHDASLLPDRIVQSRQKRLIIAKFENTDSLPRSLRELLLVFTQITFQLEQLGFRFQHPLFKPGKTAEKTALGVFH